MPFSQGYESAVAGMRYTCCVSPLISSDSLPYDDVRYHSSVATELVSNRLCVSEPLIWASEVNEHHPPLDDAGALDAVGETKGREHPSVSSGGELWGVVAARLFSRGMVGVVEAPDQRPRAATAAVSLKVIVKLTGGA